MTSQVITLHGPTQREFARQQISAAPDEARVCITDSKEERTKAQNRMIHKWFGEIAKQLDDFDALEIKGVCHRRWGLCIKMRCPQWSWIWANTGEKMDYEQQCKLLASGILNVSSSMSVAELSEYMDGMFRHYTSDGIRLTDPEARKYEGTS